MRLAKHLPLHELIYSFKDEVRLLRVLFNKADSRVNITGPFGVLITLGRSLRAIFACNFPYVFSDHKPAT